MRKRFTVYITRVSYKPEFKGPYQLGLGDSAAQWTKHNVLAETRLAALEKILPEMQSEQSKLQDKYVSVWVGSRTSPSLYPGRLNPFQVVIETWTVRERPGHSSGGTRNG